MHPHLEAKMVGDDRVELTASCFCGSSETITLTDSQFNRWEQGEHIQNVAPELSEDQRERLISGTCATCWDEMWSEEDE